MDLVFDIETGPLPEAELLPMIPGFDPTEVKVGNIKDPDKITAKIKEAEEAHYRDAKERAALDALTGRLLAFGMRVAGESVVQVFGHDDERVVLNAFDYDGRDEANISPIDEDLVWTGQDFVKHKGW